MDTSWYSWKEELFCFVFEGGGWSTALRGIPGTAPVLGKRQVPTGRCYDNFDWFQTDNNPLVTIKVSTFFTYWWRLKIRLENNEYGWYLILLVPVCLFVCPTLGPCVVFLLTHPSILCMKKSQRLPHSFLSVWQVFLVHLAYMLGFDLCFKLLNDNKRDLHFCIKYVVNHQ